jgi:hypothetical protein
MSMLMTFLMVLAWIGLIGGGFVTAMRIWGALSYSEIEKLLDQYKGVSRTHPIAISGTIFIVSAAFLIARALN